MLVLIFKMIVIQSLLIIAMFQKSDTISNWIIRIFRMSRYRIVISIKALTRRARELID